MDITRAYRVAVEAALLASLTTFVQSAAADAVVTPRKAQANELESVEVNFRALARQRPWRCPVELGDSVPDTDWRGGESSCAWQGRLRFRMWRSQGGQTPTACVSPQAIWWTWAHAGRTTQRGPASAWRSAWTSAALHEQHTEGERVAIVQRGDDGRWWVGEWRWNPSPRSATRQWQQGRWDVLVARAQQLQQTPAIVQATRESSMLWKALELNIGQRVGEMGARRVRWLSDGICLQVDADAPGAQLLQVPYSAEDSRLEQRAAMQLQLARRFPKANWLTPFTLVPALPQVKNGAKFYAIWTEGGSLNGQLWIPTKGGGPLVRVRIATAAHAASLPGAGARNAKGRDVLERELLGIAARWAGLNE